MKLYLMVTMHVNEQQWAATYGNKGSVADEVVDYYTNEVISGHYTEQSGLVKIVDTFHGDAPRIAPAAPSGMTAVTMVAELDVDRHAWATEYGLEDKRSAVAEDVVAYFEHNVLEGSYPVDKGVLLVAGVAAITRPRKKAKAAA